ncbi:unnamed protein product [Mesocestoides corti]|uniref:beta-N-acetylhexosaminidase n=1 Tax=Mesocestoides corti TaxID=53468 RepID=A0A0R3UGR1_MESCO|nr:unnamed protein product [Mesocestoides corti]
MRLTGVLLIFYSLTGQCLIPHPASIDYTQEYYRLPSDVEVQHNAPYCFTLHAAIKRLLGSFNLKHLVGNVTKPFAGNITRLILNVSSECDELSQVLYPTEDSKEAYNVSIRNGTILITAPEVWGAMYGLTTVAQLVNITDGRGDAMATVKMNVLHWHIVDDTSFPYESYTFPKLSAKASFISKGAYSRSYATYTQKDVQIIIEHARSLGIRVIPEFDTPGHTLSWGLGYPNLLTACHMKDKPEEPFGPFNPTKNTTYDFMGELVKEILKVFPGDAIHLGGDEVDHKCWQSNPDIREFMQKMGYGTDYSKLENYYISNLLKKTKEVTGKEIKAYVWQEVFDNKAELGRSVIINVWKSPFWRNELDLVTKSGREVVFSACWYLDYIKYAEDWIEYYRCDPASFTNNTAQLALLKGGGAAMWGEFVDGTNLISRSWPRGAVVAERTWSPASIKDVDDMRTRLRNYRCFLLS